MEFPAWKVLCKAHCLITCYLKVEWSSQPGRYWCFAHCADLPHKYATCEHLSFLPTLKAPKLTCHAHTHRKRKRKRFSLLSFSVQSTERRNVHRSVAKLICPQTFVVISLSKRDISRRVCLERKYGANDNAKDIKSLLFGAVDLLWRSQTMLGERTMIDAFSTPENWST